MIILDVIDASHPVPGALLKSLRADTARMSGKLEPENSDALSLVGNQDVSMFFQIVEYLHICNEISWRWDSSLNPGFIFYITPN